MCRLLTRRGQASHALGLVCIVSSTLLGGCVTAYEPHKDIVEPKGWPDQKCSGLFDDYFETSGEENRDSQAKGEYKAKGDYGQRAIISNLCVSKTDESQRLSLAVIEFDDEGTHWNREQFTQVRRVIEHIGTEQAEQYLSPPESLAPVARSEGIFLVAFVHGWRHDAAETSMSLQQFRWFVRELAKSDEVCNSESILDNKANSGSGLSMGRPCGSRPHVVGVYLAWRGKSTGTLGERLVVPEIMSFWGRKATALRVAGTPMTETFFGMLDALEKADEKLVAAFSRSELARGSSYVPVRSRSMIIGHSFGARVVEHAFAQALIGSRLESQRASGDKLNVAFASAQKSKSNVEAKRKIVKDLKEKLAKERVKEQEKAGEVNLQTRRIEETEEELAELVSLESAKEQFAPYRSPSMGKIDQAICERFDQERVERCVNDSRDVWRVGSCLVDEISCLYRSYACSIRSQVQGFADPAQPLEDLSEWCAGVFDLALEGDATSAALTGLVVVGADDDIGDWESLGRLLKELSDQLPRPPYRSLREDERVDWGPATTYLGQMEQWSGSMDFWPRIVAIWERVWRGVTRDVRTTLVGEIDEARRNSAEWLSDAGNHLTAMLEVEGELEEREEVTERIKDLESEKREIEEALTGIQVAISQLEVAIQSAKGDVKQAENGLTEASVAVKMLVDTTLRPPADLILLVNPATEALSARNLIYALCSTEEETNEAIGQARGLLTNESKMILERRPWIVSITSAEDTATKRFFPLGVGTARFLSLKRFRDFTEIPNGCEPDFGTYGELVVRTAGHQEKMLSHRVISLEMDDGRAPADGIAKRTGAATNGNKKHPPESSLVFKTKSGAGLVLNRSDDLADANVAGGRKYWVVKADAEISRGHNDVFNNHTLELTMGLIHHSRLFDSLCPRVDEDSGKCINSGD